VRRLVLAVLTLEKVEGEVAVAFLAEAGIAELNERYRGLPEATDVLSFPGGDDDDWPEPHPGGDIDREQGEDTQVVGEQSIPLLPFLGDIAVCPAVAARYAAADGHPLAVELGRLLVHGVLHILGWDHESDQGKMRLREEAVVVEVCGLFVALTAGA
jgi:probable rRNA maturation factor